VRIVTLKRPPEAIDGAAPDNFHVGDIYDVSPNLAILLTAAGWVRSETRRELRRGSTQARDEADLPPQDRRHTTDRRQ
jgi:hypothetical protein